MMIHVDFMPGLLSNGQLWREHSPLGHQKHEAAIVLIKSRGRGVADQMASSPWQRNVDSLHVRWFPHSQFHFLQRLESCPCFFLKNVHWVHMLLLNLCSLTPNKEVMIKVILVTTFVNFCRMEVSVFNTAWIIGVTDISIHVAQSFWQPSQIVSS